MSRIRAVLFDLDGTLIDSIQLIVEGMEYAWKERAGPRPTRAEWTQLIGTPLDKMIERWAIDPADAEYLRKRYREYQLEHHNRLVTLFPGVEETLRALHADGYTLGIVSSKFDWGIRRSMDFFKLTDLFKVLVGLDATTRHKPNPEPVLFALQKLNADPTQTVYVGDSPHDMESGNGAGVVTIAATWGPYTRDQIATGKPGHWIDRMGQLPGVLATI